MTGRTSSTYLASATSESPFRRAVGRGRASCSAGAVEQRAATEAGRRARAVSQRPASRAGAITLSSTCSPAYAQCHSMKSRFLAKSRSRPWSTRPRVSATLRAGASSWAQMAPMSKSPAMDGFESAKTAGESMALHPAEGASWIVPSRARRTRRPLHSWLGGPIQVRVQGRRPLLSGDVSEHLGSLMTRGLAEMGRGFQCPSVASQETPIQSDGRRDARVLVVSCVTMYARRYLHVTAGLR